MTQILLDGLEIQNMVANSPVAGNLTALWHPTRMYEYPWALARLNTRDVKVLDVGCNQQFSACLCGAGIRDVTVHHTSHDLHQIGSVFMGYFGWVAAGLLYRKHRFKVVVGLPHELDVKDATYDVIFNLSVMEHIPSSDFESWLNGLWRLLKPGGHMVVTCDWPLDLATGESIGTTSTFTNHDWMPFIQRTGALVVEGAADCPWHPSSTLTTAAVQADPDIVTNHIRLDGTPEFPLAVYGFILQKPVG